MSLYSELGQKAQKEDKTDQNGEGLFTILFSTAIGKEENKSAS